MKLNSKELAATAIFTALVTIATIAFSVYVPATYGFFNIGETMVYTSAIVMGPIVGGFAGGVGSAIADIFLGYGSYAPGTLVIKGIEGFIVGYFARNLFLNYSKKKSVSFSIIISIISFLLISYIGMRYFSGPVEITIFNDILGFQLALITTIPEGFWVALGIVTAGLIILGSHYLANRIGWLVFSTLIGGIVMIFGYFIYGAYVLNLGVNAALVEVPINMGQVLIGTIVAIPLSRSILNILEKRRIVNKN